MMDLTKLTTAFGLLDAETQQALRDWPHGWDVYDIWGAWQTLMGPMWMPNNVYRARPAPVTKPSIDWSHVAEGWNWLAVDANSLAYVYEHLPEWGESGWMSSGGLTNAPVFASYRPGTCDWRDSLICRPGFEVPK